MTCLDLLGKKFRPFFKQTSGFPSLTITLSLTLILNQVDKYFHRVTTIPLGKKMLAAHAGTASNFFWDSQLGLILMRSTSTINNSQMDLQRAFRAPRSPDSNRCKMIAP